MEDVTIESLVAQGKVVTTTDLSNPANDYMVVGVYQKGTNKSKGDGTSYKNYVISIAELLGGGAAYTASNGVVLVGNDIQLASQNISQFVNNAGYLTSATVKASAWTPDGNSFGSEKFLGTLDNFALPIRTNNVEVARFTTAGYLLLNTTSALPNSSRLSVDGNVGTTGSYNTFTAGGDPYGVLRFNNVAGTTQYFAAGYDTFGAFLQSYGNSLILNHLGNNVGIGLTNPTARLHLKDNINGIASGIPNAIFETSTGGVLFESKSIDGFQMKFTEGVTNRGSFTNAGGFAQLISQFRFTLKDYANVSKLWMDSTNGYIGIGDAYFAAGSQLDVRTTGAFTNAIDATADGGYAVIGTANTGVGVRGVNNASYGIGVDGFSTNNVGVRGQSTNGIGGQFTAPIALMAKGIDATSANYALQVRDSADNPILYARNDGNVYAHGVGNVSTNTSFGLNNMLANTTGSDNTAYGVNALRINSIGSNNVAVGKDALYNNTSSFNTAVGYIALELNTSERNTGLGYGALSINSTGLRNTAVGMFAGNTNQSGSDNVFIGYNANAATNNLTNAIAIGYGAIVSQSNTMSLGDNVNVAIGHTSASARLYVRGIDATNINYAAIIDNVASNPILTARNDQKVYVKASGGFAADVTFGVAGFTDTIGWRSTGYQRIRHGVNDFALGDPRANIEWDTSAASARFITGIKNDDTWGIFCANASDYGFEIDRTSRNIGMSMSVLSTAKLAIKGNTANSSESAIQLRNSLNATTFEFFNNGWFVATLPTSSAGLPSRALWDNAGVVNITP